MGKVWHLNHFKCAKCNSTLSTQTFFEKDNRPYCKHDYIKMFCHKCSKCGEYILKETVCAFGKFWHVECFVCASCNKQIKPPYFFEKNGLPYCDFDYAKNFTPVCVTCKNHIFEDYVTVKDRTWHPNCFICGECKRIIKKKYFWVNGPTCEYCVKAAKSKISRRCIQDCCQLPH